MLLVPDRQIIVPNLPARCQRCGRLRVDARSPRFAPYWRRSIDARNAKGDYAFLKSADGKNS
jgi:hypothetical protein